MSTTTTATPTVEDLHRLAREHERVAAQLRAAAAAPAPLAVRRAIGQARSVAERVLQWGQQERAA